MSEPIDEIIKFIKERLSNPFFVNLTVAWSLLHWDVIYITLFVSSGELPKDFLNKYEYVKSVYKSNDFSYNYCLPFFIALAVTLLKQPVFLVLDAFVQIFKVLRKNIIELINKSENYQKFNALRIENEKIFHHYKYRKMFLFYGAWEIRKTELNKESKYFEAVYNFTPTGNKIIGTPVRNTIDPIIIEIDSFTVYYESNRLLLQVTEVMNPEMLRTENKFTYELNLGNLDLLNGHARINSQTDFRYEVKFKHLDLPHKKDCLLSRIWNHIIKYLRIVYIKIWPKKVVVEG